MEYRRDIDGLRGIAILVVILYHAKLTLNSVIIFPGGFLGVDIFFVISGYLITKIIILSMRKNNFSFANFFERRLRRLALPLFLVIIASSVAASILLLEVERIDFEQSALSAIFFVSNFNFYWSDSYWSSQSSIKPLLHTWSLAVEEQYYIIFPIVVYTFFRFANDKKSLITLCLLVFLSLSASHALSENHPTFAFFMLPTRAWEICAGGVVALLELKQFSVKRHYRGTLAFVALSVLIASFMIFDSDLAHPSIYTAIPVFSVSLLIMCGAQTYLVDRVIASTPLVYIGKISYSLYLWHWPILVFGLMVFNEGSVAIKLSLIAISVLTAALTYLAIERPLRLKNFVSPRAFRLIFGCSLLATVAASANGLIVGAYNRYASSSATGNSELRETCKILKSRTNVDCRVSGDGPVGTVIWGDSHAGILAGVKSINQPGYTTVMLTHPGCPPITEVSYESYASYCDLKTRGITIVRFIKSLKANEIVLMARWNLYTNESLLTKYKNWFTEEKTAEKNEIVMLDKLRLTISQLSEVGRVSVIGQMPDMTNVDQSDLRSGRVSIKYTLTSPSFTLSNDTFKEMGVDVRFIDTESLFCNDGVCLTKSEDGNSFYRDGNHPSLPAAEIIWQNVGGR